MFDEITKLPEGWAIATIPDIVCWNGVVSDGDWVESKDQDPNGAVRLIQLADIGDGKYQDKSSRFLTIEKAKELNCTYLKKGDLLIARMPDPLGRACIFPGDEKISVTVVDICIFRSGEQGIDHQWLMSVINSPKVRQETLLKSSGTTRKRISKKNLSEILIPLPPLNEQRRIVAKIEALKARIQKAKDALEAIPPLLDQFRQSVLAAAFRGDLTADWREKNPNVKPASILISSLNTPYPEVCLDVFEKSSNYELPPSWIWIPLGKLGLLMGGGTPSKDNPNFWNGSIPWVSPKDMKQDRISDSIDHISEEAISNSSVKQIPKGAILFVVRGMILNHTFPVAITESVVTVNQDMKAFVPEVIEMNEYLLLVSKFIENKILFWVKAATHGTRRLETPILRNWAFPIPPSKEQLEIVRRVQKLLKTADLIEQSYKEAKAYLDQLDQSILAKAFRGELVPQDPNDEPASILLEHIQAERVKREAEAKTAKMSTGKTTGQRSRKAKQQDLESIQLGLPGLE